jgi:hypothetical protein
VYRLQPEFRADVSSSGALAGYTFVDTGVPDSLYTAISPLQWSVSLNKADRDRSETSARAPVVIAGLRRVRHMREM